ncbi:MAG: hypothetical protein A3J30_00810 [Candidatus Wildermuthbacteria bacterium RIFCSPLOWO2_02_FULL_47_9c]|uniref:Uncharacterized protein n=1 Tax=Candidatus Wildermuthbacteria bacterium RIFCSPLOWO2_02_FULL_47_9c TaxID=1802466 RepID=A0A1G2RX36_9BACT|nr:MAG: hypothetical protein A3J30_00810 [Candidatus Wildermuthbacteria bacterium RIFCSPLOWO2_02_FULL_47_9c]
MARCFPRLSPNARRGFSLANIEMPSALETKNSGLEKKYKNRGAAAAMAMKEKTQNETMNRFPHYSLPAWKSHMKKAPATSSAESRKPMYV